MSLPWTDVATRARGLATHLLGRHDLEALAGSADLASLAEALRSLGRVPIGVATARDLELALRRGYARQLEVLGRWCGPRAEGLPLVFEAEDLRSLRRLVRAATGAGWDTGDIGSPLTGLVPTPSLPERALATLAEQTSPRDIATLLGAWHHPFAPALERAVRGEADLFALDRALERGFVERACAAAKNGDRPLVEATERHVDASNAMVLLVLAQAPVATRDAAAFFPGGRMLTRERFVAALTEPSVGEVARHVADAFAGSPLAEPFRARAGVDATGASRILHTIESSVLVALSRIQHREALSSPLGTAPILAYTLALRIEAIDLATLVWGLALGAPRMTLVTALVTP